MFTQEENKGKGLIKYLDVYRYSLKMFEQGKIPYKFSEDFWRKSGRQGREAIDKANEIYEYTLFSNDEADNEKIIDTIDTLDKFFQGNKTNRDKIQGAMLINENKLKKYIQKFRTLTERLNKRDKEIIDLKQKDSELQERLKEYEEIFFQWLDASSNKNVPLLNLVTTGKTRSPIVDRLFQSMFTDDPLKGYEQFEKYRRNQSQGTSQQEQTKLPKNNVYPLAKKNSLVVDLDL